MPSEARFAQRPKQIAESFVAEKVQALIGDLESRLLLCIANLASDAGLTRWIVRLVDTDIVLLLHAVDQLVDDVVKRSIHLHLPQLLARLLVQHVTLEERTFNGTFQIVERLIVGKNVVGQVILKAAL